VAPPRRRKKEPGGTRVANESVSFRAEKGEGLERQLALKSCPEVCRAARQGGRVGKKRLGAVGRERNRGSR